jgi:hypothetical protein
LEQFLDFVTLSDRLPSVVYLQLLINSSLPVFLKLIIYVGGFAHRRLTLKPERMVSTTDRMVLDGIFFVFKVKRLLVSDRYSMISPGGKKKMYVCVHKT